MKAQRVIRLTPSMRLRAYGVKNGRTKQYIRVEAEDIQAAKAAAGWPESEIARAWLLPRKTVLDQTLNG